MATAKRRIFWHFFHAAARFLAFCPRMRYTFTESMHQAEETMHKARHNFIPLVPALCFLLVMALMTGASELLNEREIIFPEAAAIALGALAAPKFAWRTTKPAIFFLITGCAALGMAIVLLPVPLPYRLILAYLVGQTVLLLSKTTFAPLISAVVLPVLLETRSPVYLAAAVSLTALILILRGMLEKCGLNDKPPFMPVPVKGADVWAMLPRTLLMAALCLVGTLTGWRLLVCPPLLVAFTEFSRRGNGAMKKPLIAFLLLSLCALAGAALRLVTVALALPLTLAAVLAALVVLLLTSREKMYLPPAAAVALLSMLIPERELLLYPFEIIVASAVYVVFALLAFQRRRAPHPYL